MLRVLPSQQIKTCDGIYTVPNAPCGEEIWHSDRRFRELERQVYYK